MKNILITGGLGYLGGRIAQHLLNTNKYQITLCSRSLTQNSIPQELIDAKVVLLDILNYSQCLKATEGIDCVIHLAALNEIDSAANPELAALVNTQGTKNLLDAAIANKTNRFVYFSTAHIYGTPLQGIITEETLAKPVHPYAITHKNSEDYIRDAHKQCKIQGISLRLSNAIGSPLTKNINRWTLIANDLCKQAVETGKLTLKTPGTQLRDFICLSDVAKAVEHIISIEPSKLLDGIFNLGGENSKSIFEIAQIITNRAEVVLKQQLQILRPSAGANTGTTLNYVIDKLKATGFKLTGDINTEVDSTLLNCKKWFIQEDSN